MSTTTFKKDLTEFHEKLDKLYKEAHALFSRHGATEPQAAKLVMPPLDQARAHVHELLHNVDHTFAPED